MPTYVYKGLTDTGLIVKNKTESNSRQTLLKSLKESNITPIEIQQVAYKSMSAQKKKKKNINNRQEILGNINTANLHKKDEVKKNASTIQKINMYLGESKKITPRDIVVFSQNFALLKKADFNNIHALKTLIQGTENPSLKGILEDVLAGVEGGDYMYTTMEYYSDVFPTIYINMIKVGELSGSLSVSLEQAVRYLEESQALTKRIKAILVPNIVQFALLLVMLVVGTLVAIPAIEDVISSVGSEEELPAATIAFADFLDVVMQFWYIPTIIIIAILATILTYIKTEPGKYNFHYFKYKMPVFGELIFALDFSRLMKAMLLNLKNGMRIQEAIDVSTNIVKNKVMLAILQNSSDNIVVGTSWIEPFEKSGFAKPMTVEMLTIGMQTDLTEMMEKLVEYMQIDIDHIMTKIMKVMPQIVYSIVGVVLIFFVLVVLVPILEIYMGNFLFSAYGV